MSPEIDRDRLIAAKVALMGRVDNDFTLHPPTSEAAINTMDNLRNEFKLLAMMVVEACPLSREQSLSITKLEESLFYAIASIARNQESPHV